MRYLIPDIAKIYLTITQSGRCQLKIYLTDT